MIVGIDEVGRGPIAGPVCVAVFAIKSQAYITREIFKIEQKTGLKLRDSKKQSKKDREAWVLIVEKWKQAGKCDFAITMVSALIIDNIGIVPSIRRALSASLRKLNPSLNSEILLDGGLRAPAEFKNQKTIIKGDEKEFSIAFASIMAKVHRDKHMCKIALKHPLYSFEKHVGYGTKAHYLAIKKYGRLPVHRNSFLNNLN